jgi:hypothetical protein
MRSEDKDIHHGETIRHTIGHACEYKTIGQARVGNHSSKALTELISVAGQGVTNDEIYGIQSFCRKTSGHFEELTIALLLYDAADCADHQVVADAVLSSELDHRYILSIVRAKGTYVDAI